LLTPTPLAICVLLMQTDRRLNAVQIADKLGIKYTSVRVMISTINSEFYRLELDHVLRAKAGYVWPERWKEIEYVR